MIGAIESKMEDGRLKQEEEEEPGCHGEPGGEEATPVQHTHTHSHGELAEFGLDAAVPHAHPGER